MTAIASAERKRKSLRARIERAVNGRFRPARSASCSIIIDVPSPLGAHARVQALQAVYAAPILVLSARFRRGLAGSAEAARRLGVKKVLPKPFTRKEFLSAARESLEGVS